MSLPRPLLARLYHDLAELQESPYPGVALFTDDADIRKLCLVLTPPSGPWKDLSLHFDVELPTTWPMSPPRVQSSVSGIEHPNLFGSYICCDLLKEQFQLQEGYTGGYSPALALRGLFLQFLTFFSSTKVEQDYGGSIEIGDYTMVRYIREADVAKTIFQKATNGTSESDQTALEKLWKSSASEEVVINIYELPKGNTTQTAKLVSGGNTDRLHRFETVNPNWEATYNLVSKWTCKRCPYGSDDLPAHRIAVCNANDTDKPPVSALFTSPSSCLLEMLNDDVLLELASHLLSESLISFSIAYPRFHNLVTSSHVLLQRELRCFFLRTSLQDSILGIGVAFDPTPRTLSSDFDWLSLEAFTTHHVRRSIQKREFQYFLPLAFSLPHFERAREEIWACLAVLDEAVRDAEKAIIQRTGRTSTRQIASPQQPHQTVEVIYKMMNNIVVSLMKSCDDVLGSTSPHSRSGKSTLLHASEKAVISYCHLFHLLLCLSRSTPAIFRDATDRLRRFIQVPESRVKAHVPDLGELIVLITLVLAHPVAADGQPTITWALLNGPFLEEAIVRNVRWVLKDMPELEVLESGTSEYRLQKTFLKSKTSLRLIMFQITFLDMFIKTYAGAAGGGLARLDENYGFPEPEIPGRMVEEVKAIYRVDSWPGFFQRVRYARGLAFGKEKFSEMLRVAIRTSGQRGYHTPKPARELHLLWRDREFLEKKWIKGRS
ncbi:hypothetical protein Hypma_000711 [Hypsizygus marmoreus]|uniref:UBC core domain-containing protein n=1 Tax=Hypsizygus marmoreus TaxID=39966 RepID=A0A369J954_HYPMA|nr:hypothetical protein Hypma_000711 [Hypsizygus marmoreus]